MHLLPIVASDQAHERGIPGFDLLEFPSRELDNNESVLTICEVQQGLPLGYCGTRTCSHGPRYVIRGKLKVIRGGKAAPYDLEKDHSTDSQRYLM